MSVEEPQSVVLPMPGLLSSGTQVQGDSVARQGGQQQKALNLKPYTIAMALPSAAPIHHHDSHTFTILSL